jgi:hypothetical protein
MKSPMIRELMANNGYFKLDFTGVSLYAAMLIKPVPSLISKQIVLQFS